MSSMFGSMSQFSNMLSLDSLQEENTKEETPVNQTGSQSPKTPETLVDRLKAEVEYRCSIEAETTAKYSSLKKQVQQYEETIISLNAKLLRLEESGERSPSKAKVSPSAKVSVEN